jgi:hypothetical protein
MDCPWDCASLALSSGPRLAQHRAHVVATRHRAVSIPAATRGGLERMAVDDLEGQQQPALSSRAAGARWPARVACAPARHAAPQSGPGAGCAPARAARAAAAPRSRIGQRDAFHVHHRLGKPACDQHVAPVVHVGEACAGGGQPQAEHRLRAARAGCRARGRRTSGSRRPPAARCQRAIKARRLGGPVQQPCWPTAAARRRQEPGRNGQPDLAPAHLPPGFQPRERLSRSSLQRRGATARPRVHLGPRITPPNQRVPFQPPIAAAPSPAQAFGAPA